MSKVLFALCCILAIHFCYSFKPALNKVISKDLKKRKIINLEVTSKAAQWTDEKEVKILSQGKPGKILSFIDITDTENLSKGAVPKVPEIPNRVENQHTVNPLLPSLSKRNLENTIKYMSTFWRTRHATTDSGIQAAIWLKGQYDTIVQSIQDPARRALFSVELVDHRSWRYKQNSVVVKMRGSVNPELVVVLGSHLDSTSRPISNAPGADDDATGAGSVLEVFRVLASSSYVPKKTIEWHAYAAEEMGLLGSADIANKYKRSNVKVHVMMQMDMNGYNPNNVIALVTNGITPSVNVFVKKVIAAYCDWPPFDFFLRGGSSDHASWLRAGYRVCFPFESRINPNIHTPRDTLDKLDLNLSLQHMKMALGFVVEVSQ